MTKSGGTIPHEGVYTGLEDLMRKAEVQRQSTEKIKREVYASRAMRGGGMMMGGGFGPGMGGGGGGGFGAPGFGGGGYY